jgi:hypothetical protein
MRAIDRTVFSVAFAALAGLCIGGNVLAQEYPGESGIPGDPKPDINIVGPTRNPVDIRDEGLKQQNEPACVMRVGDSDCIQCFFNDYRTVDLVGHEDAWIASAESCDGGDNWTSRVTPNHPNHLAPIGFNFAADARAIAIPGMTIHGFIVGNRGSDQGAVALQHWLHINKEDFDFNEPTLNATIVESGTEGKFLDKGELLAVMDDAGRQHEVTLSFAMENPQLGEDGVITRSFPSGTLYAAYAEFTGSNTVKLRVKRSYDWGQTWQNKSTKLTESLTEVSGITMTHLPGMVMAMWRQVNDVNDNDAMYYAITTNGGNSWSKPILLRDICRFDQPSATLLSPPQVTFRTNDFPWIASDGKNIYAFYSERQDNCVLGRPEVVMQYTSDGVEWSDPVPIVDIVDEPGAADGARFMPAAFGARGKVQVAWYDTRRENVNITPEQPFVADYIPDPGTRINRKVDVYTARIMSDVNGDNVTISPSTRVNRFDTVGFANGGPKFEVQASFANPMMFKDGFLSFIGDYIAVAAQEFRITDAAITESNFSPVPGESNLTEFFVAYSDNRDVVGDVLFGDTQPDSPYTPPDNVGPTTIGAESTTNEESEILVARNESSSAATDGTERGSTEGLEDVFTNPSTACVQGADRTRDSNIYGSVIRDQLRLSSPVDSRPLSGILRAIPLVARNSLDTTTNYRLLIANQPPDFFLPIPLGRASFRQKPDRAPFPPYCDPDDPACDTNPVVIEDISIPANSAVARTVFLVSTDLSATVDVGIFDGDCALTADMEDRDFATDCAVLGVISLGGSGSAGELQQPDYLSTACGNTQDCDPIVTELHNPLLENSLLEAPLLENPLLENPLLENPLLENPLLENPLLENPLLENFGFEAPLLENPLLENPLLENIVVENPLLENPLLENPLLENPLLENSAIAASSSTTADQPPSVTWVDSTAIVRNDGNVTTAYNFDITAVNFESTAGGDPVSQVILWKQYAYGTSRDCVYQPVAAQQVVATINQPDNELEIANIADPFAGEASMILAPGERGYVTYRFFGTPAELQNARIAQFTASSQAANCDEFDDEFGPPPNSNDPFYSCQDQIFIDQELILEQADTTAPIFDNLAENQVLPVPATPANAPGGACVDPVATGLVTASDDSSATVTIECVNGEGDAICTAVSETGLSVPASTILVGDPPAEQGPSLMTCTATDDFGNTASINLFLDVDDDDDPFFSSVITEKSVTVAADASTASVNLEGGFAGEDQFGVDPDPVIACSTDNGLTSSDQIPIGNYTTSCTITDASGNSPAPALYSLTVEDGTAPVFTVVPDTITAPIDITTGTATVSFVVEATDNSGIAPTIVCDPASGSQFSAGTTTVECTATDNSGNSATAHFDVEVGYSNGLGIFVNKRVIKAGSTNQLTWVWQDETNNNVDTSADPQILRLFKCSQPEAMIAMKVGTPGQSGFFFRNDFTWEYNWQSDNPDTGEPLPKGSYCISVESQMTGDMLFSPSVQIK